MSSSPPARPSLFWIASFLLAACSRPAPPAATSQGPPQRILPTNASALDYVYDIAGPERIVAIPATAAEFCAVPLDAERWGPGRTFDQFSAEVLLAFDPDLVVVSPWQDRSTLDRLREHGLAVLELASVRTLDDVRASLEAVGEATGEPARAREWIVSFDERVAHLRRDAARRGRVTGLVYTNYGSGGWVAGGGTTADLLLELAGIVNVAAERGFEGHNEVSIEELLTFDPDVIVISRPSDAYGATRANLESQEALAGLRALRSGAVIELEASLFSTASHHLLDGAEALAAALDRLAAQSDLGAR